MTDSDLLTGSLVVAVFLGLAVLAVRRIRTGSVRERSGGLEGKPRATRLLPEQKHPSDEKLTARLLQLKEEVIDKADHKVPEDKRLLRNEMVRVIVDRRPQTREEFLAKIPLSLRQGSETSDSKHIQMIVNLCKGRRLMHDRVEAVVSDKTDPDPDQAVVNGESGKTNTSDSHTNEVLLRGATTALEQKYPNAYRAVEDLFGTEYIRPRRERLNEIYRVCEDAWSRNMERIGNTPVRYLLISEAPPWSDPGTSVSYFYRDLQGPWCTRIVSAILGERSVTVEETLQSLADRGFMLLDSLPFPCPYSRSGIRTKHLYQALVSQSLPFFVARLNDPRISWAADVKVALAFKKHGEAFINATSGILEFPNGLRLTLTENLIATDSSNYTNASTLKKIYQDSKEI